MKKIISVFMLVCIVASLCTVSAFADVHSVSSENDLRNAITIGGLEAGDTITLIADITLTADINLPAGCTINAGAYKFILAGGTLNGNGSTLNSSADRAINVNSSGAVGISNLTISTASERGINVIQQPAKLTLNSVTVTGAPSYAINVAGSSVGSSITISGGSYTGLNVLNIHGASTQVVAAGASFITNDTSSNEGYANIVVGYDAPNSTVSLENCILNYNPNGEGYNFTNQTSAPLSSVLVKNAGNSAVNAVSMQAVIDYGGNYYSFATLADAVDYAKPGETVTLLRDVDMGGKIVNVNKNVTLNANGRKITNGAFNVTPGSGFDITNLGNPEQKGQLMSGKLPQPGGIYHIPATADNSNMALWSVLALALLSTAFVTRKKKAEN